MEGIRSQGGVRLMEDNDKRRSILKPELRNQKRHRLASVPRGFDPLTRVAWAAQSSHSLRISIVLGVCSADIRGGNIEQLQGCGQVCTAGASRKVLVDIFLRKI